METKKVAFFSTPMVLTKNPKEARKLLKQGIKVYVCFDDLTKESVSIIGDGYVTAETGKYPL
jgi:hypothetical protein